MINFIVSLNGVRLEKQIPTKWEEVNYRTFLKIPGVNDIKALSMFIDIEESTLRKATISGLDQVLSALSFLSTEVPITIPATISGYKIPKDIGFEPFGRYVDLKDIIDSTKPEDMAKKYPMLCAIYASKEGEEYDFKTAEEREELFWNAPCTEVMGAGNFILMKLIALRSTIETNSQKREGSLLMKFKLALKAWLISTAFMARFFIWKHKHRLTVKNYTK